MIYDRINNSADYRGISPLLDKALDFIQSIDITSLDPGKNEIEGDNLFVMLFDYMTIDESDALYEIHKKYIDIQLVLSGNEYIRCYPESAPEVTGPYDESGDAELYYLSRGVNLKLEPGVFALFMPGEFHAPKLSICGKSDVRKIVVKIRV